MRPVWILAATIPSLLALASLALSSAGDATAAQTQIEAGNFYFCDTSFTNGVCEKTINAGDIVLWQVTVGVHTVTECDSGFTACPPSAGFDSGTLGGGSEFSHTFSSPGVFYYRCNIHPDQMRGKATVVALATPTPTAAGTSTPVASPASTPTAAAPATPAKAPSAGGDPSGGWGGPWAILMAAAGALLVLGSAGLVVGTARRS